MKVKITVRSQQGHCSAGHHVGDHWTVDQHTCQGICFNAFCSLLPWVHMLRFGAVTPWDVDVPCPDTDNPVIFRLEKMD